MKRPILPAFYYLDHFYEMITFVRGAYDAILTEEHHAFIGHFEKLSKDAQCLLIRMVNRKGAIFNRRAFRYAEITDIARALDDLIRCGHARRIQCDDYGAFLACLPKAELVRAAKASKLVARSSWSKAELIAFLEANLSFECAVEYCEGERFIALGDIEPLAFLLYIYFGKTEADLKNFALRDLGVIRTNNASSFSARFTDGEEARACFYFSKLNDRLEVETLASYRAVANLIFSGPACSTDYAVDIASRTACRAGRFFEKNGDAELAERLYRVGQSPECHERLVQLLLKNGDKASAKAHLRQMIDDPASDEEQLFATDFYARKFGGRRTGLHTDLLRAAQTLVVDDTHRGNPEAGVAGVMRRQGAAIHFAENTLWLSLFGLLFWDELFESGQLHSGFDWLPHCLKDRSFTKLFATQVEEKLAAIESGNGIPLVLRTVAAKWGTANGIFAWNRVKVEALRSLLEGVKPVGLATVLRSMAEDFRAMRDGFPDLMLVEDGVVSFVEVKADGDLIRRNQLARLRQLNNVGIAARICRVDFRFDPEQDYVVVDIETTGGWTSGDRITEIGAVKMRNHEVIEEWHSLINPQRSIPSNITRLTGITNDMVRGAPVFAEIADTFMAFMGDAIFVAHNVNFDYGFI